MLYLLYVPEKAMATHSSTLAWKIPWMEEPDRLQFMGLLSQTWLIDFTFPFHLHALENEMATHSSVLAWRIPGTGEPGGLPSMGSHRVGHYWSDLAAAAAVVCSCFLCHRLGDYRWKGSLWTFYAAPLSTFLFCSSTILLWLLWVCNIIWSQRVSFLQFHFSFSRLLWLFGVFYALV